MLEDATFSCDGNSRGENGRRGDFEEMKNWLQSPIHPGADCDRIAVQ